MPLLYGEGASAFLRLQQEILKISDDHSILAFARKGPEWPFKGQDSLLAQSPLLFSNARNFQPSVSSSALVMVPTSKTIETTLLLCPLGRKYHHRSVSGDDKLWLGILQCTSCSDPPTHPALVLEAVNESQSVFRRVFSYLLVSVKLGGHCHVSLRRDGDSGTYHPPFESYSPGEQAFV